LGSQFWSIGFRKKPETKKKKNMGAKINFFIFKINDFIKSVTRKPSKG